MDNFAQEFNGMAIMDTTDALCQQVTHALDNELRPSMQLIGAAIGHKKRLQTSINDKVLQITTLDTEFDGNLANAKARYLDPAYLLKILSLNEKLKEDNEKEMAQIKIMQTKISSKSILLEEIATLEFELAEATTRKEQEEKEEQERIEQLALLNQQNQIAPEVSSAQELELSSPELPPPVQLAEPLPGTSSAPIALNQNEIIESTSEEAPLPQQKKKRAAKKRPTTNVEIATSSSEVQPQQVIPKPKEASKSKKKTAQVVPDPQPVAETYIMQDIRTRLRVRPHATITYADSTTPEIPKRKNTRTFKKKATEPINSPVASTSQQSATPVATKKKAPKGRKATKSTATGSNSVRRSITPLEVPELVESPMNPKPKPAARGGRKKKVTIVEPVPDSTSALGLVDPQPSSSGSSNSNLTNAATQTPKKTKTNKKTAKKV